MHKQILIGLFVVTSCFADIPEMQQDLLQVSEIRIAEKKDTIARDFAKRDYLAKATYAVTAGSVLWLGYKWGMFNFLLPDSIAAKDEQNSLPEIKDPSKVLEYLAQLVAHIKEKDAATQKHFTTLDAKNEPAGHWFINGIKYVGWTGVTIAGSIIIQTQWQHFFEYALATPTFHWFLGRHSIISTIDVLRRNVYKLTDVNQSSEFNTEHRRGEAKVALESLVRNIEELAAFTDYYMEQLDQDLVYKQKMDSISRYLFNITNEFLQKIQPILENPAGNTTAVACVDDYKNDVSAYIKRCQLFEEEFVEQD